MKREPATGNRSNGSVWRRIAVAVLVAAAAGWSGSATAEECEKRACGSGETYRDGHCYSSSGFPTFAESHHAAACPAGWTLDVARGMCLKGGECCDRPLCGPGETFSRMETYQGKPYGVCESSSGAGYRSHTRRECEAGWDLVAGGRCKKRGCGIAVAGPVVAPGPPGVVKRPDLVIRDWWVVPGGPKAASNKVKVGQKYQVCFVVANIGPVASGPFKVQGGGLGVPFNPTVAEAALAAGAAREGCLTYPTTPSPGNYNLGVTADASNAVAESNEGNNDRSEAITVLP